MLESVPVDLPVLLRDVQDLMAVQVAGKGLRLELELAEDLPVWISGDPTRLRQVLVNLVSNAIRFTPRGSIAISGRSAARGGDRILSIEVTDTGIGLSIAASLVERMGGELAVRSAPGSGSTFCVELPLVALEPATGAEEPDAAPPLPRRGLRVLVAEEGAENQRLIRLFLERLGCRVEIVSDGPSVLRRVLEGAKDLDAILMDVQMPELDGHDTTRALRRGGVSLPIIALSAHALADERERCLAVGCDDYLSKPIDRAALAACLAQHA